MSSPRVALASLIFVILASLVLVLDVAYAATHHREQGVSIDCAIVLTRSGQSCR